MVASLVEDSLAVAVIDALTSQIWVVDGNGVIVAVNQSWKQFAADNSGGERDHVGADYLGVCARAAGMGSEGASDFGRGLREVLAGARERFQYEYPCHSPTEQRWFLAHASPLRRRASIPERFGAVVAHIDITGRKLAELDLARLAATDPLTGVPNRRFFEDYAGRELSRLARFGGRSSLLMIDIDRFKDVNDSFGHVAGDEALRRVAALGRSFFRASDLFARIGGEEFVCLLAGTDAWGALIAAEAFRDAIEQLRIEIGKHTIHVTVSIGATSLAPADASMEAAAARADAALYQAKAAGRNCVKSDAADDGVGRI